MAVDPIKPLQKEADRYQSALDASSTAYGGDQPAQNRDVENQIRLASVQDQITKTRDIQLKNKWGLNETSTEGPPRPGILGRTLDYISRPLYGVVGAVESVAGKGVSPSIGQNISENITTGKRTFSDLLKREGVPYIVAAPLGFALDVAFDPFNAATAGVGAILPRVAMGVARGTARGGVRAGLEAAKTGVQSSLPGVMASRLIKRVGTNTPYLSGTKFGQAMGRATDVSATAATKYDKLTGRDFLGETLPLSGVGLPMSDWRITLGDLAKHAITSLPAGVGNTIWKNMEYSSSNWLRIVRLKDALMKSEGVGKDVEKVIAGAKIPDVTEEMAAKIRGTEPSAGPDIAGSTDVFADMPTSEIDKKFSAAMNSMGRGDDAAAIKENVKDALDIGHNPGLIATADGMETVLRLASEAAGKPVMTMTDVERLVKEGALGDTGIEWYDKMRADINRLKISTNANINKIAPAIKAVLDAHDKWITIFKLAKVPGSPSAFVNAAVGNPSMYGMMGGDITDAKYWKMLTTAAGFKMGTKKSSGFFQRLNDVPQIRQWIEENPTAIRTGWSIPVTDRQKIQTAEQLLRIAKDHGMIDIKAKVSDPNIMKEMSEITDLMRRAVAEGSVIGESEKTLARLNKGDNIIGGLDETKKIIKEKGGNVTRYDVPVGMFSQEFMETSAARKMLDAVEERAKTGGVIAKALSLWLNKAPSAYESVDQINRMGTFAHLTLNGWTERELNIARRTIQFHPEDIMDKWNDNGIWRYRIAPDKAMEVVMETYLNYAAMPGFIRMMRQFPLLNSPFVSFAYGMSLKTANTLATNPAFFNKAQFALNDFGGTKSPLEKEALSGPYYSYLNTPTMFKLPFFRDNPLYVNLGYALPYYSLNAFNPAGRGYEELLPNTVVSAIDKSGFMSNPLGQMIFNYAILPRIISDSADPLGSFGQRLYPKNATGLEKAKYAMRDIGESVIPGFTSIPGGLTVGLTAPQLTEYMPSYRWRQIAYATQGKDQYGVSRKEAPLSRTLRGILSSLGIPIQSPIDLTNVANQGNNKKK